MTGRRFSRLPVSKFMKIQKKISITGIIIAIVVVIILSQKNPADRFAGNQSLFDSKDRLEITPQFLFVFDSLLSIDGFQLGLHRIYKTDKGHIFISLALIPSFREFHKRLRGDTHFCILKERIITKNGRQHHCFLLKRNKAYLSRLVYSEAKLNNLIVIDRVNEERRAAYAAYEDLQNLIPD